MHFARVIAASAIGLSLLSVAACGDTQRPARSGGAAVSATPVAVNLPSKDQLGQEYLAIAAAYNDVWRKNKSLLDSGPTLAKGRSAASDMATANWALIEKYRAMRSSVEVPGGNYPTAKDFYSDVHTTLGQAIDKKLHFQDMWTRMRDATSQAEFDEAWNDPSYNDDGVTQRRLRSLLGLPDVP